MCKLLNAVGSSAVTFLLKATKFPNNLTPKNVDSLATRVTSAVKEGNMHAFLQQDINPNQLATAVATIERPGDNASAYKGINAG